MRHWAGTIYLPDTPSRSCGQLESPKPREQPIGETGGGALLFKRPSPGDSLSWESHSIPCLIIMSLQVSQIWEGHAKAMLRSALMG